MNMNRLKKIFTLLVVFISVSCDDIPVSNSADTLQNLPVMDLEFNGDDYLRLLDNKTSDLEVPVNIAFKGQNVTAVIRASGAGSRFSARWSYKVETGNGSSLENVTEFNLSSQIADPTMMYTTIASRLYRLAGFPIFNSEHLFLRINNRDQGLFLFIERVEEPFFLQRNIDVCELYKSNGNSKFTFTEINNPQFDFEKKIPDDNNYNNLIDLIHAVDTSSCGTIKQSLGSYLDINNYIRYHALTTLINNPDAFDNNFFIFKQTYNSSFEFLPWDFDRCFERTEDVGLYGKNAIIEKLLRSEATFNLYKSELRDQLDHIFTLDNIDPIIDSLASTIREGYDLDPYLGKGMYNFDEEIEKLSEFIDRRRVQIADDLDNFSYDDYL
jgi:spore coat protein H